MAGRTCAAGVDGLTYHGGALDVAERLAPEAPKPWIDLSTGINPHAYPLPDLGRDVWTRLPGAEALAELEAAAAYRYGVTAEIVVAGPGSQALIQALARIAPRGAVGVLGADLQRPLGSASQLRAPPSSSRNGSRTWPTSKSRSSSIRTTPTAASRAEMTCSNCMSGLTGAGGS